MLYRILGHMYIERMMENNVNVKNSIVIKMMLLSKPVKDSLKVAFQYLSHFYYTKCGFVSQTTFCLACSVSIISSKKKTEQWPEMTKFLSSQRIMCCVTVPLRRLRFSAPYAWPGNSNPPLKNSAVFFFFVGSQ